MILEMFSFKGIFGALSKMAGGFSVGILGFVVGENISGNLWVAIIVSALCQVIFGWLTNRPKMVSASSQAEISARQQSMSEWANLLKENNYNHAEQIRSCREENKELSRLIALIRVSKHNILDAYGAASLHIQLVDSILKDNNLTIPSFTPRTVRDMFGVEDEEMMKLVKNGK